VELYSLFLQSGHLSLKFYTLLFYLATFLKMASKTSISTPIPPEVNSQSVIQGLHNHESYIRTTCPQLISYTHLSGSPALGEPCVYEVTDLRPYGETTYRLTLTNQPDGIHTLVDGQAPTGPLIIRAQWVVAEGRLDETVESESAVDLNQLIMGSVERSHPELHRGFIAQAINA
jgi:ferredoxin-thioredoxin reductase catalytic subunit